MSESSIETGCHGFGVFDKAVFSSFENVSKASPHFTGTGAEAGEGAWIVGELQLLLKFLSRIIHHNLQSRLTRRAASLFCDAYLSAAEGAFGGLAGHMGFRPSNLVTVRFQCCLQ